MPIIKSAIKKLKQDKTRTRANSKTLSTFQSLLRNVKKGKSKDLSKLYSAIDKAVKKGVIHKKKAARLKSQVVKLVKSKIKKSK